MLKPQRIPTHLIGHGARPPVPIVENASPLRARRLHAVLGVLRWLAVYFLRHITGRYDPAISARNLRELFEGLGGLWIKIGQLISLRADVLSPDFCRELSLLQHRSSGFSPDIARQMVETQLGGPIEQFFSEFDALPFAAASISQVHRAVLLKEGVEVAVKVQRPDVVAVFSRDLDLLRAFIRLLNRFNVLKYMAWDELMWEIEQIMLEEVDYRYEAANIRRARKSLKPHGVYVPKLFDRYSTQTVLVMEYIHGALMSDFIAVRDRDPIRLQAWLSENNINPKKLGGRLLFTFLRQMMEDNLFHADLHPGNIILLRNSRFALIDLGSVGTMQKQFLQRYLMSFRAMATRDYEKAADLTFLLSPHLPVVDLSEVKEKMVRAYRAWEARAYLKDLPYHEKSLANAAGATGRILFDYRIVLSWSFMKISRTWATLDASLNYLMPEANYVKLFRRYFVGAERRALSRTLNVSAIKDRVSNVMTAAVEYGDLIGPIVRRQALVFQGVTSKIAYLWTVLFRILKIAVIIAIVVVGFDLLTLYEPGLVSGVHEQLLVKAAERIPAYDWDVGLGVILALLYFYWLLGRLRRKFSQRETGGSGKNTNV